MNTNIFKQSASIFKDNVMMIIQPLCLWALVSMFVAMPLYTKKGIDLGFIFASSILVLCFITFLAGWYYCIKLTIANKNKDFETPEEKNLAQLGILKNFFVGVGEYILPVGIATILYGGISYGLFVGYKYIAIQAFNNVKIPDEFIKLIGTGSQEQITQYIQTLSTDQLATLSGVMFGGIIIYFLFEIFILWYGPTLFYTTKNPIAALFKAIVFTFKNFFTSIMIVVVMGVLNMFISFSNLFFGNSFLLFIPMMLSLMYFVYYVLTVFLYYEQTQNISPVGAKFDRQV